MTDTAPPNPLATPDPWNWVADGYVTDTVPHFEKYAARALELADLAPTSFVLDVACGPGTLSVLAAKRGHRVSALDFAPQMVERLRTRAKEQGVEIDVTVGNGEALPYPEASFEAAFSMFGLIFFPDRLRGFRELLRVLKPSGRAVVSSWTPADTVPELAALFRAIKGALPGLPFGDGKAPLGDPEEMRSEMQASGFRNVEVQPVAFTDTHASPRAMWESFARGGVPIVLLRKKLGETAYAEFAERAITSFERELGTGPVNISWSANLGVGTKG